MIAFVEAVSSCRLTLDERQCSQIFLAEDFPYVRSEGWASRAYGRAAKWNYESHFIKPESN